MNTSSLQRLSAIFTASLLIITLSLNAGCLAAAAGASAGAAAVAWVRGELRTTINAGYDDTVGAANKAVKQLQFSTISESKDALLDNIVARNSADKKIEIKIEKIGGSLTSLSIRVGTFGDQPVSLAILEKVKANL